MILYPLPFFKNCSKRTCSKLMNFILHHTPSQFCVLMERAFEMSLVTMTIHVAKAMQAMASSAAGGKKTVPVCITIT